MKSCLDPLRLTVKCCSWTWLKWNRKGFYWALALAWTSILTQLIGWPWGQIFHFLQVCFELRFKKNLMIAVQVGGLIAVKYFRLYVESKYFRSSAPSEYSGDFGNFVKMQTNSAPHQAYTRRELQNFFWMNIIFWADDKNILERKGTQIFLAAVLCSTYFVFNAFSLIQSWKVAKGLPCVW